MSSSTTGLLIGGLAIGGLLAILATSKEDEEDKCDPDVDYFSCFFVQ